MTRKALKPGMVIKHEHGYWIVLTRTTRIVMSAPEFEFHDSGDEVDGVVLMRYDLMGQFAGWGWEHRLSSSVWDSGGRYTVLGESQ